MKRHRIRTKAGTTTSVQRKSNNQRNVTIVDSELIWKVYM